MMKIDEAYFGILLPIHGGSKNDKLEFELYNIFDNYEVQLSIAYYKTKDCVSDYSPDEILFYCFNCFWKRSQFEYYISDNYKKPIKIDVYDLYIKPNQEYLLSVIDMISKLDCKRWLRRHQYGIE